MHANLGEKLQRFPPVLTETPLNRAIGNLKFHMDDYRVYQELGESSVGNLPSSSQKRVCQYYSMNFFQALGRFLGLKITAKATFDAVPRKQNGLDTSQGGYCSNQS